MNLLERAIQFFVFAIAIATAILLLRLFDHPPSTDLILGLILGAVIGASATYAYWIDAITRDPS